MASWQRRSGRLPHRIIDHPVEADVKRRQRVGLRCDLRQRVEARDLAHILDGQVMRDAAPQAVHAFGHTDAIEMAEAFQRMR